MKKKKEGVSKVHKEKRQKGEREDLGIYGKKCLSLKTFCS